jgi:hypothetical protein
MIRMRSARKGSIESVNEVEELLDNVEERDTEKDEVEVSDRVDDKEKDTVTDIERVIVDDCVPSSV